MRIPGTNLKLVHEDDAVKSFDAKGDFSKALKELDGSIGNQFQFKEEGLTGRITNCGSFDELLKYYIAIEKSNLGYEVKDRLKYRLKERYIQYFELKTGGLKIDFISESNKNSIDIILSEEKEIIEEGDCIRLSEYKKAEEPLKKSKYNIEEKIKICSNGTDEMEELQGLYKILIAFLGLFSKGNEKKGVIVTSVNKEAQSYDLLYKGLTCEIPQRYFD